MCGFCLVGLRTCSHTGPFWIRLDAHVLKSLGASYIWSSSEMESSELYLSANSFCCSQGACTLLLSDESSFGHNHHWEEMWPLFWVIVIKVRKETSNILIRSLIYINSIIQSNLHLSNVYNWELRIKGLAQGPSRLTVLGLVLMTFQFEVLSYHCR